MGPNVKYQGNLSNIPKNNQNPSNFNNNNHNSQVCEKSEKRVSWGQKWSQKTHILGS